MTEPRWFGGEGHCVVDSLESTEFVSPNYSDSLMEDGPGPSSLWKILWRGLGPVEGRGNGGAGGPSKVSTRTLVLDTLRFPLPLVWTRSERPTPRTSTPSLFPETSDTEQWCWGRETVSQIRTFTLKFRRENPKGKELVGTEFRVPRVPRHQGRGPEWKPFLSSTVVRVVVDSRTSRGPSLSGSFERLFPVCMS